MKLNVIRFIKIYRDEEIMNGKGQYIFVKTKTIKIHDLGNHCQPY